MKSVKTKRALREAAIWLFTDTNLISKFIIIVAIV